MLQRYKTNLGTWLIQWGTSDTAQSIKMLFSQNTEVSHYKRLSHSDSFQKNDAMTLQDPVYKNETKTLFIRPVQDNFEKIWLVAESEITPSVYAAGLPLEPTIAADDLIMRIN